MTRAATADRGQTQGLRTRNTSRFSSLRAFATLALLGAAVTLPQAAYGALYTDPATLPANKAYDYIIIGASPGGSVLAKRLTEVAGTNVLLIEAGPNDAGVLPIEVPLLSSQLQPNQLWDWNYTTVPQSALNQRVIQYPRGRVLGGSTSINFMIYSRGSEDDFNQYAEVTGDSGYSWSSIEPYFRKLERLVPPVDGHNTQGEVDPSVHGTSGPLNISVPGASLPTDSHVVQVTQELPNEFPFNVDMNNGKPIGVGWLQGTLGGGARVSSSVAYVQPIIDSDNLDVLIDTTVTKLIKTDTQNGQPVFRGVQFAQSSTSPLYALNATKEVILAAGAINTPQLLMLSGLGPASALRAQGITPILDIPAVGQNLVDHPMLTNQFGVASADDDLIENLSRNATFAGDLVGEWIADRMGVMVTAGQNHVTWLRMPANDSIFKTVQDPSAGPLSPHFEFLVVPGFLSYAQAPPDTGFFMTILTIIVTPTSRGSVTLSSSDPFVPPTIDPNFLSTAFDRAAMRAAVRSAVRFASAPTWKGFLTGPAASFAGVDVNDDDALDAWAREQTSTIWHPTGTARMGKCGDSSVNSVVNPDMTVRGVVGLRVMDASVLPFIPAAHPQAAIYAFAERLADLIKSGKSSC
ncbi:aryl-alcohol-oxidase from pleurotus Eryingii [Cubamyces lactineus]|nr:aryl-alcohol-oxidase from pleurotus Eryingii [Cubamyces lactineus]